jgi:hypothetical protein
MIHFFHWLLSSLCLFIFLGSLFAACLSEKRKTLISFWIALSLLSSVPLFLFTSFLVGNSSGDYFSVCAVVASFGYFLFGVSLAHSKFNRENSP